MDSDLFESVENGHAQIGAGAEIFGKVIGAGVKFKVKTVDSEVLEFYRRLRHSGDVRVILRDLAGLRVLGAGHSRELR